MYGRSCPIATQSTYVYITPGTLKQLTISYEHSSPHAPQTLLAPTSLLSPLSFVLCPLSFLLSPFSFLLCPFSYVPSLSRLNYGAWNHTRSYRWHTLGPQCECTMVLRNCTWRCTWCQRWHFRTKKGPYLACDLDRYSTTLRLWHGHHKAHDLVLGLDKWI